MRLLTWNDSGNLSLTAVRDGEETPPYTILSHTWGADDDEVILADLQHEPGRYQGKIGYEKIQFCGEQTRRDGFKYFWVDTCCIDKKSSSELSEAINSMFKWYSNAQKCYVYLSDVSADQDSGADSQLAWKLELRKSRWFKRGWTLQELLAPSTVEFYSGKKTFLGTKITLAEQIHEITTIPVAALYGTPFTQYPIAERWRWTQGRQTKRKEDKAYCLLGVFEVFMHPMYGEGNNAFRRLEEKVNKRIGQSNTTDLSIDTNKQLSRCNRVSEAQPRELISLNSPQLTFYSSRMSHSPTTVYERSDIPGPHDKKPRPHLHKHWKGCSLDYGGYEPDQLADFMAIDELSWKDYFRSLTFEQLHHRKSNVKKQSAGTCTWLLKSYEYEHWKQENGLLLVRGHAGCGKSTLIKYALTDHLSDAIRSSPSILPLSFFFDGSGMVLQTSTHGMFRSLLHQLLTDDVESRSTFYGLCREVFGARTKIDNDLKWNQQDLQDIFEKLVIDCSTRRTVRIFIDAIDECGSHDREELISFFHSLRDSYQRSIARIGIFMTTRTHPNSQILSDFSIRLEERTQDDIKNYVEQELRLPDETENSRNRVKDLLIVKANGSFLWLVLVIQRIHELSRKGINLSNIKSDISRCPQQLNQLYEDLLGEVVDADISEVGTLLQWITFASRPLSARELIVALTIHSTGRKPSIKDYFHEDNPKFIPNEQKLRTRVTYLSRGLVGFLNTLSANGGTQVQFYHESIKEFMLTKGLEIVSKKFKNSYDLIKTADAQLANTCLWFLSCREVVTAMSGVDIDYLKEQAFFEYARDSWFIHAAKAEKGATGETIDWSCRQNLLAWLHINQRMGEKTSTYLAEGSQAIHIAAKYGLISLTEELMSDDTNTDEACVPEAGTNVERKSPAPVSTYNLRSKTPYSQRGDESYLYPQEVFERYRGGGQGALSAKTTSRKRGTVSDLGAAKKVQKVASKSLVAYIKGGKIRKYKASVTPQRKSTHFINVRNVDGSTPLWLAANAGQLDMVTLLCREGADVCLEGRVNSTPLHTASESGHLEVVKYLFEHGAESDIHTPTTGGWTPLYAASCRGHLDVVKYLLEYGAESDIHTSTIDGWTPLCIASYNGHLDLVKCLLEHGAESDVHTSTTGGWTLLCAASYNGHLGMVKYLLEHGAESDIHTPTTHGWTPLCAASCKGHLDMVKYLFEHGAESDIHTTTIDGWTPLYAASHKGHLDVVEYLFEHGAESDIHTTTIDGWTPLYTASCKGHLDVVKYFFEHGAESDIHTTTTNGWTPLCAASYNGHLDVVKYLFEYEAESDIHTTTINGWTPLYAASCKGHLDVVKYFFEHGAESDIHTTTTDGWTPLCAASCNGHLDVVKCLFEHGAESDIHTTTINGWTPLYTASHKGHLDVVKYLLEYGAESDIHTPTTHGWTPLCAASCNGHLDVVKCLFEYGAESDIHTSTSDDWTLLFTASYNGHLGVVKYLLEHGAESDIHTTTTDGWTPLCAASHNGRLDVVKYLFEHGAETDIHTTTTDGWTPLCAASYNGHLDVVKCLFEYGAESDIHTTTTDSRTPLYEASCKGHLEVVKYLLEMDANIDVHEEYLYPTPLIGAIVNGQKAISSFLVHASANLTFVDNLGRTAIDWLKLLRTHDELLQTICPHPAIPPQIDIKHVRASVKSICLTIIRQQMQDNRTHFGRLGRYLLVLNDTDRALMAFYQQTSTTATVSTIQHDVECDLCSVYPIVGNRFVCRVCPDVDLCMPCMEIYQEDSSLPVCEDHKFVEIGPSDSMSRESDAVRAWLQDTIDEHSLLEMVI